MDNIDGSAALEDQVAFKSALPEVLVGGRLDQGSWKIVHSLD